jgi:hypothetical protein
MIVDCDRCEVRGDACTDCVITVLLGAPPGGITLDATERRAIDALADAGMVPQLRLVPTTKSGTPGVAGWTDERDERSDKRAV